MKEVAKLGAQRCLEEGNEGGNKRRRRGRKEGGKGGKRE